MASKPSLMLFDDPITGLDPLIAVTVDDEIIKLRDFENVTSLLVTHQIRDAYYVATHRAIRENCAIRIVEAEPAAAAPPPGVPLWTYAAEATALAVMFGA